ncbi:hypothetical protein YWY31_06130 [Paenibacillus illinoisensis]
MDSRTLTFCHRLDFTPDTKQILTSQLLCKKRFLTNEASIKLTGNVSQQEITAADFHNQLPLSVE